MIQTCFVYVQNKGFSNITITKNEDRKYVQLDDVFDFGTGNELNKNVHIQAISI